MRSPARHSMLSFLPPEAVPIVLPAIVHHGGQKKLESLSNLLPIADKKQLPQKRQLKKSPAKRGSMMQPQRNSRGRIQRANTGGFVPLLTG